MRFMRKLLIILIAVLILMPKTSFSAFAASGEIKNYEDAKTGDKVKLGVLYLGGLKQVNPANPIAYDGDPYYGDIPDYILTKSIEIRDETLGDSKIKWVKITDLEEEKIIYISDRNILKGISWDSLNIQGLVQGKNVTIEGRNYKLRLLDGGTKERVAWDFDTYGGTDGNNDPGNNEWDKYITNEGNIDGLDPSDTVWNYINCFSLTQQEYNSDIGRVVFRGYRSTFCGPDFKGANSTLYGYRPVLEVPNPSIVTFENEGTILDSYKQVLENGDEIIEPSVVLHKAGYTFDGWYDGTNKWDFNSDTVNGNVVLKAEWIDNSPPPPTTTTSAAVTFENDDIEIDEYKQIVEKGDKITEPADVLHKDGYTFDGWYDGTNKWDFNTPVTENMVLKAKWIVNSLPPNPQPSVADKINAHFYKNSGNSKVANMPEDGLYNIGEKISGYPKRNKYSFTGWYTAANGGEMVSVITNDIENYYAHWSKVSNNLGGSNDSDNSDGSSSEEINVKVELPDIDLTKNLIEVNNNIKYLLNKDILRSLKGNGEKTLVLKRYGYVWTINGNDIPNIDEAGYFNYNIDGMLYSKGKIDDLIKDEIDISSNELQYIKMHINEPKVPVRAITTYSVDKKYNGFNMYLYRYNTELDRLEIVEPNVKVKDNNVNFHVTYGGDCILVKKPLKNAWGSFWSEVGDGQHQYIDNGAISIGFKKIENNNYYFNENGIIQKGWVQVNNKWYFMDDNGVIKTGWFMENNKWYYFDLNTGEMNTGWIYVNYKWYFLDDNGVMRTGWLKYKNDWYYLDLYTGEMKVDWILIQEKWYYLNTEYNEEIGIMKTGWNKIKDIWYFFNNDGTLAVNNSIDGYTVNSNGEWVHYKNIKLSHI